MKKCYIFPIIIIALLSLGLSGCELTWEEQERFGTLRISNQSTDFFSDVIDRIVIRKDSNVGELLFNDQKLNLKEGQIKEYRLKPGEYFISIRDTMDFDAIEKVVRIYSDRRTTLIWLGDKVVEGN